MNKARLAISDEQLGILCSRYYIKTLSVFGSILRSDYDDVSDIDILVEFEPGHTPGLAFFAIEEELTILLGKRVDLHTPGFLSSYFRDHVLDKAERLYVS
jgi:predicted nucleotidyltransferase